MSASLASLAPDFFAILIQCLNGDDFISLMQTGNRLLRHKLTNNCFGLSFFDCHGTKFPFAAFNLHKLKSLAMIPTQDVIGYLDFSKSVELALSQGCKSLEKLDLRFFNSLALFLAPETSLPRLTVRDRFPSLTTLILHYVEFHKSSHSLFRELPETLTTFFLQFRDPYSFINLSSVAKLPKKLTSLEIRRCKLKHPSDPEFSLETVFPPNLVHLWLDALIGIRILDYLPSTLQTLRFKAQPLRSCPRWKLSKVPKELFSLRMNLSPRNIDVDAPLPSTLEIFDCSQIYVVEDGISVDHWPKNRLKIIPDWIFFSQTVPDSEWVFQNFPNLESAKIKNESTIALLPATLKTLKCLQPISVDSALPSALKELYLSPSPPSKNLNNIPASLTSLSILSSSEKEQLFLSGTLFPWNESDIAHIASKMRLTSLMIDWIFVQSGHCLAPLARMQTLKIFKVGAISWDGLIRTPKWLPQCLPSSLKELEISAEDKIDTDAPKPREKDFFSLWDLKTVTPSLTSLYVNYRCEIGDIMLSLTPNFLASLPKGLLKLNLVFISASMDVDAIAQLPRSLKSLRLVLWGQCSPISDDLFVGLPSLAQLEVETTKSGHSFTPSLFEKLPKSIVEADITIEDEDEDDEGEDQEEASESEFNDALQRFLKRNRSSYYHSPSSSY